ncbi:MAG: DNA (cytosine-5-)-methyltransferase [Ignavibacteriales bacterium]|nr:DNA (cytosine-5-)-methyltransferase [Ignavibacteriales bacterium]
MKFRLGELFSGPGGLAYGAKLAGFNHNNDTFSVEHVWANDNDSDSCVTFQNNIVPNNKNIVICKNVQDLNLKKLEKIDAFAYGFPCNDFSIVGERKGFNGKYGPLYFYGVSVLNIFNPFWFFAENVGGITNANKGKALEKILLDLGNAGDYGYELTINKYKFEEYGIPQKRHRIIIIGIRKDLNLKFQVPAPTNTSIDKQTTAYQAICIPPIKHNDPNHVFTSHPKSTIERLKYIPPGENAWFEEIPNHLKLNVKGAKLSQIYKRLRPNEPSYTVTGSGGGGTHVYHWEEPRALTNRERARLQTFPDDFIFYGSNESIRRQIGMAIPPQGVKIIIESIFKTFAGIDYPFVKEKY